MCCLFRAKLPNRSLLRLHFVILGLFALTLLKTSPTSPMFDVITRQVPSRYTTVGLANEAKAYEETNTLVCHSNLKLHSQTNAITELCYASD